MNEETRDWILIVGVFLTATSIFVAISNFDAEQKKEKEKELVEHSLRMYDLDLELTYVQESLKDLSIFDSAGNRIEKNSVENALDDVNLINIKLRFYLLGTLRQINKVNTYVDYKYNPDFFAADIYTANKQREDITGAIKTSSTCLIKMVNETRVDLVKYRNCLSINKSILECTPTSVTEEDVQKINKVLSCK